MSMPELKADMKIPDLWYDFYARLLPGCVFLGLTWHFVYGHPWPSSALAAAIAVGAAYCCALVSQPISSRLVVWIETRCVRGVGNEHPGDYVNRIQKALGTDSRRSMIISKMHGEVTFHAQMAVLGAILCILQVEKHGLDHTRTAWNLLAVAVFLAFAYEVAARRVDRARKYDPARFPD